MHRRLARTLTGERKFMLACARLDADPSAVASAARGVDSWERVIQEARRHHLLPLLSRSADAAPYAPIPQPVREQLRLARQKTVALNAVYLQRAGEVLRAFARDDLAPVVLKGVALVENLYGDIGLRAFCDLDVLLPIEDLDRAERVLEDLGYRSEPTPHTREWYFVNYYQLPRYARPGASFCIELHWDLGRRPNPFRIDVAAMRARAVAAMAAGVPVHVLDPEDQLLHLAVHLAWGNGFDGHVRGIVDIAEVLRRGIDWNVFEERVRASNTAQVAVPAIELAHWLLDAGIDERALSRLQRLRGGLLSRSATRIGQSRVLTGGEGHRTLMRLFWMERLGERLHLLKQNFGSVEFEEFDKRPPLAKRLAGGLRRAAAPFIHHA